MKVFTGKDLKELGFLPSIRIYNFLQVLTLSLKSVFKINVFLYHRTSIKQIQIRPIKITSLSYRYYHCNWTILLFRVILQALRKSVLSQIERAVSARTQRAPPEVLARTSTLCLSYPGYPDYPGFLNRASKAWGLT